MSAKLRVVCSAAVCPRALGHVFAMDRPVVPREGARNRTSLTFRLFSSPPVSSAALESQGRQLRPQWLFSGVQCVCVCVCVCMPLLEVETFLRMTRTVLIGRSLRRRLQMQKKNSWKDTKWEEEAVCVCVCVCWCVCVCVCVHTLYFKLTFCNTDLNCLEAAAAALW